MAEYVKLGHYQSMTFLIPTPSGYRILGSSAAPRDAGRYEFLISADLIDAESLSIGTRLPEFHGQPDFAELKKFMQRNARDQDPTLTGRKVRAH